MSGAVYRYAIKIVRVIDGDTLEVDVDLGFRVWLRKVKFRLSGINCPEIKNPGGIGAREFVSRICAESNWEGIADTIKADKYGNRWDAVVYLPHLENSLNHILLEQKYAEVARAITEE
jgi:micrococcal nuclease